MQILAHNGILFGGRYDRQLGLDEPLKINVFDTPGFADSDADLVSLKFRTARNLLICFYSDPTKQATYRDIITKRY